MPPKSPYTAPGSRLAASADARTIERRRRIARGVRAMAIIALAEGAGFATVRQAVEATAAAGLITELEAGRVLRSLGL